MKKSLLISVLILLLTCVTSMASAQDIKDALVPFLQDSYIVQGVASSCESLEAEQCIAERLYLSLYWKDRYEHTAEDTNYDNNTSLIVELDPNSSPALAISRCWKLSGELDQSHVGGLAFVKTTTDSEFLYTAGKSNISEDNESNISEDNVIERYPLLTSADTPTDALEYGSLAQCGVLESDQSWSVPATAYISHVVLDEMDYLLVGDFCWYGCYYLGYEMLYIYVYLLYM
jgi:hypothetical protein